jgi:predicted metal-dependent HD superfamily phosphohydrolase
MAGSSEAALIPWWWLTVGYGVGEAVLSSLLDRHREPHRHYHTATHIEWVLRHIDDLCSEVSLRDRSAVLAAAFFHDAIYEPQATAGENERTSADLAVRELHGLGWEPGRSLRVAAMIVATATHDVAGSDIDTGVLLDADLAVLAADAGAYAAYVNGVRHEYTHLDDATWAAGRSAVLRHFMGRPAIFSTEPGRRRWEDRARANIEAELASLKEPRNDGRADHRCT